MWKAEFRRINRYVAWGAAGRGRLFPVCFGYARSRKDLRDPNEEDMMAVAGKWSINPQTLDEYQGEVGAGWLA